MPLPENPETLIVGGSKSAEAGDGVKGLPDAAQLCSCENVSKGEIVRQVRECEAKTLNDIKKVDQSVYRLRWLYSTGQ